MGKHPNKARSLTEEEEEVLWEAEKFGSKTPEALIKVQLSSLLSCLARSRHRLFLSLA